MSTKPAPIIATRVPLELQAVYLASGRGEVLDTPPTKNVCFSRRWPIKGLKRRAKSVTFDFPNSSQHRHSMSYTDAATPKRFLSKVSPSKPEEAALRRQCGKHLDRSDESVSSEDSFGSWSSWDSLISESSSSSSSSYLPGFVHDDLEFDSDCNSSLDDSSSDSSSYESLLDELEAFCDTLRRRVVPTSRWSASLSPTEASLLGPSHPFCRWDSVTPAAQSLPRLPSRGANQDEGSKAMELATQVWLDTKVSLSSPRSPLQTISSEGLSDSPNNGRSLSRWGAAA